MKHLAIEGTRSYECWGIDDPFPCRNCLQKTYTMNHEPSRPEAAIRIALLHGARVTREEYMSVRDIIPKPPQKRYPLGVVIMWAIAALSLGFAFAGLLLGCSGTSKADNYCCYGGKTPSCVDAFAGCTFHADDSEDAGGSTCGMMTCD